MNIVVDTSVIVAVLVNEPERSKIVSLTIGMDLLAPGSVHWEIGNALSAMIKRRTIHAHQVETVLRAYKQIPIRLIDVISRQSSWNSSGSKHIRL